MGSLADSLTRIRRFIRDPDAAVWTNAALLDLWNQAQIEIAQKSGILQRAETYAYPTRFTFAYTHDFEGPLVEGDTLQVWNLAQQLDRTVSYTWEAAYWMDSGTPAEQGTRTTQPWEDAHTTAADITPVLLHAEHNRTLYAAFDGDEITGITRWALGEKDPTYRTATGSPLHYYPVDEQNNIVALYPKPTITFDEWEEADSFETLGWQGYTFPWEQTHLTLAPVRVVFDDSDKPYQQEWERDYA